MTTGVGLVLEGGGMRATYTGGVLDAFMDAGVDLRYVIGVSAGSNAGGHYVAGQRERSHRVFVDLVADPRYAGWRTVLRERSWFGMDFLFRTLPDELAPFDYEGFRDSPRTLVTGVTDCATGVARYYRQRDRDPRWFVQTLQRASCSLPVLSPPVLVEGRPCVDGGVTDSIPLRRSIEDGNPRNVVVLTRNAGYRKPPARLRRVGRVLLGRYPALYAAMLRRPAVYNASLDLVEGMERAGSAFVLRPVRPLVVGRMERDIGRLEALYRQGYDETMARMTELEAWLRD
ncbi:MAG: patatin family protein [Actinobacteria bacterium]|nr:patatin family protein [Actinomycetota bacterium]